MTRINESHEWEEMPANDDELLRLWERGRRMALACCRQTLGLLRRGAGGFYQADDFLQDLFLEFWALVKRHGERWGPPPWTELQEQELYTAWQRMLYLGGIRILQRTPQRLWRGQEYAVEPRWLDLDGSSGEGPQPAADMEALMRLPPEALRELTQPEQAESTQGTLARLEELESALWALRPSQRQIIYLAVITGMSAAQTARALGLKNYAAVRDALSQARETLRRLIAADTPQATESAVDTP